MDVAELLLDRGADVNARDKRHQTPLHETASLGRMAVVKLLLEQGTDVNARDKQYEAPCHQAIVNDHPLVAKLLEEAMKKPTEVRQ